MLSVAPALIQGFLLSQNSPINLQSTKDTILLLGSGLKAVLLTTGSARESILGVEITTSVLNNYTHFHKTTYCIQVLFS